MTAPLVSLEKLAEIVSSCSSCSACRAFAQRLLKERDTPEVEWTDRAPERHSA